MTGLTASELDERVESDAAARQLGVRASGLTWPPEQRRVSSIVVPPPAAGPGAERATERAGARLHRAQAGRGATLHVGRQATAVVADREVQAPASTSTSTEIVVGVAWRTALTIASQATR